MVAKNLQGSHLPARRQTHSMMLFVLHEGGLLRRQLLQHSSYGSGTDAQMMSQGVAGHALLFGAAQFQYRLQIIVYGFRGIRAVCSRGH